MWFRVDKGCAKLGYTGSVSVMCGWLLYVWLCVPACLVCEIVSGKSVCACVSVYVLGWLLHWLCCIVLCAGCLALLGAAMCWCTSFVFEVSCAPQPSYINVTPPLTPIHLLQSLQHPLQPPLDVLCLVAHAYVCNMFLTTLMNAEASFTHSIDVPHKCAMACSAGLAALFLGFAAFVLMLVLLCLVARSPNKHTKHPTMGCVDVHRHGTASLPATCAATATDRLAGWRAAQPHWSPVSPSRAIKPHPPATATAATSELAGPHRVEVVSHAQAAVASAEFRLGDMRQLQCITSLKHPRWTFGYRAYRRGGGWFWPRCL